MTEVCEISDVGWVNPKSVPNFGRKHTKFTLSILPRTCHSSKQSIWLKRAYRVRHVYYGYNGDSEHEDRWYDKHEYLKLRLQA